MTYSLTVLDYVNVTQEELEGREFEFILEIMNPNEKSSSVSVTLSFQRGICTVYLREGERGLIHTIA